LASSRRVQSPTRYTAFAVSSASATRVELSEVRSLILQVTHQSAVKLTSTGRPSARAVSTADGAHGEWAGPALAAAVAAGSPSAEGRRTAATSAARAIITVAAPAIRCSRPG